MPAPWGLTEAGLNIMTLDEILELNAEELRAELGANIQLGDQSVLGQINGVFSDRVRDLWELAEAVYKSAFRDSATGASLADIAALMAIVPEGATYSEVSLTLGGVNGTVLPAGSIANDPETGQEWLTVALATISGGTATVSARPATTGPIRGLTGTITEIGSPVSGWTTVTNAADAVVGQAATSDARLRERMELTMRAGQGASLEALRAQVLRLDGVTECLVVENETWLEDSEGRPPKSFEVVVRGGDNDEIADAIWFSKPAGIETFGTTTVAVTDGVGDAHDVNFSRPVELPVWIVVDYVTEPGVQTDIEEAMELIVLDEGATFTVGRDVIPFKFLQRIELAKLANVSLRVGFAPGPASSTPLTIARTELATFDSARVSFVEG